MKLLTTILLLFISFSAAALSVNQDSKNIIAVINYKYTTNVSNESGQNVLALQPNSKEVLIAKFMSNTCNRKDTSKCQYFSLSCKTNKIERNGLLLDVFLREQNGGIQKDFKKTTLVHFGQKTNVFLSDREKKIEMSIQVK